VLTLATEHLSQTASLDKRTAAELNPLQQTTLTNEPSVTNIKFCLHRSDDHQCVMALVKDLRAVIFSVFSAPFVVLLRHVTTTEEF